MTLLPPRVIGPLSACSGAVRVQGQLTGATVQIFSNGAEVASGVATSSDQVFNLAPGKTLHAGDSVTAAQKTPTDSSTKSLDAVVAQAKPAQIGPVIFFDPIYECNQMTGIVGAVPGATIEIRVGSTVRGSAVAANGSAAIALAPSTGKSDILIARQTACGIQGGDTHAPLPEPTSKLLPTPKIVAPVYACQTSVRVEGLLNGAVTTLTRSGGASASGIWTEAKINFPVKPLADGETIRVSQAFPQCHYQSALSTPVTVQKIADAPSPQLYGPLCAGATSVSLAKLIPGCQVRILADDHPLGIGEAPDTSFVFSVPALVSGAVITAEQELCGHWGDKSNAVTVVGVGGQLPKPVIAAPLSDCAGAVHVTNVHPGAWVYVFSKALGAPIGQVFALGTWVDVAVQPLLMPGDKVHAQCIGCGDKGQPSDEVTVSGVPKEIKAPAVSKPVEKQTAVTVIDAIPGATVDVYVNGAWRGKRICAQKTADISITGQLVIDDKVKASQRLCTLVSSFSAEVITVPLPPIAKLTAMPTSGNVPLNVQFADQSTGVISNHSWSFGDGATSVDPNPTHSYAAIHGGVYTVTLTVSNAGGQNSTTTTVTAKPLPPVAQFSFNPTTGTAPLTVAFVSSSSGVIDEWAWSFGDGQTALGPNPQHVYAAGGQYNISLTVKNLGGQSTMSHSIAVVAPPQPPTIVVSRGVEQVTVIGTHFPPNTPVGILLTDDFFNQAEFDTVSNPLGTFTTTINVLGCTGFNSNPLHVKASDDGGASWTNTYTVIC